MQWEDSYELSHVRNAVTGTAEVDSSGNFLVNITCASLVDHDQKELQFRQTMLAVSLHVLQAHALVLDVRPRADPGATRLTAAHRLSQAEKGRDSKATSSKASQASACLLRRQLATA